jgi:nucleotide-binding universal stress UspA family protein
MKIRPGFRPGEVWFELGRKDEPLLGQSSLPGLKEVLVPIDFSECSKMALRYAVPLAKQFSARVTLLHVVKTVTVPEEFGYVAPDESVAGLDSALKTLQELARLVELELGRHDLVQATIRNGVPWMEITTAAQDANVGLIVISTHGYTGISRVFLGSTAERVVRRAPCPVLVVRQRELEADSWVERNTQL